MTLMKMVVWDVKHGNAISIQTPNGKDILIDCGTETAEGFSPAEHLSENWRIKLDYFIVSHPHADHIADIKNVDELLNPKAFTRPKLDKEKIYEENPEDARELIDRYLEFDSRYNSPVSGAQSPQSEGWGGGVIFKNFSHSEDSMSLNNLSFATFIRYGCVVILHPGDLESGGWKAHLKNHEFVSWLKKTNFLIAPHHGRENGFYPGIFNYFNPYLTIVSDGRFGDTSATNRYYNYTKGWTVHKRSDGKEKRYVVTTRNDGPIYIGIDEGKYVTVKVD